MSEAMLGVWPSLSGSSSAEEGDNDNYDTDAEAFDLHVLSPAHVGDAPMHIGGVSPPPATNAHVAVSPGRGSGVRLPRAGHVYCSMRRWHSARRSFTVGRCMLFDIPSDHSVFAEGPMRLALFVRANCSSAFGFRGAGMSGAALKSGLGVRSDQNRAW